MSKAIYWLVKPLIQPWATPTTSYMSSILALLSHHSNLLDFGCIMHVNFDSNGWTCNHIHG
jgi:hypothetical protein